MKKAILVVSFGTSYLDTLEKTIENAENQIRNSFSEYDIYRAFTSHKIIKKLKEKYEIFVDKPEEMMEKLYEDGYEEVIMQPLHMIPGEEFIYVNKIAEAFKDKFSILKVGRPIFYYQGIEELPQDYSLFIEATKELYEKNNQKIISCCIVNCYGCCIVYRCRCSEWCKAGKCCNKFSLERRRLSCLSLLSDKDMGLQRSA